VNKLTPYDVHRSLDSMLLAAEAKKDKEHMKLCMEEVQKRKKQIATLMKDMAMEKSQSIKKAVAKRLAKAIENKNISNERVSVIAVDTLLKALQAGYDTSVAAPPQPGSEAEKVSQAAGTEILADPTQPKEVKFAQGLFQNYQLGSVISNSPQGAVLQNAKKQAIDYVSTAAKTSNKTYTEEQLKQELSAKKE
jgi:hypothetical protein